MAIIGNLRTMQLSELLQWLSMGLKTGTLVIRGTPGEKRIFFQGGRIISSSSTLEREYLGHFLVAYGYITEEELTKAMEVQQESKILLGKILVMIGAIEEEELTGLIRQKASETIYDAFLWREGAFEFIDGEIPQMPMIPISADVTGIVMEGLRRYDEWQRIRTRLKTSREVPALIAPIDASSLPERERIMLHAIDGGRSITQIAEATHNPEFFVARFVWELLEAGQAELTGAGEDIPPEPAPEDPQEAVFADAVGSPFAEAPAGAGPVAIEPAGPLPAPRRDPSLFLKRAADAAPPPEPRPPVRSGAGDQSGARVRGVPPASTNRPSVVLRLGAAAPSGITPRPAQTAPPAPMIHPAVEAPSGARSAAPDPMESRPSYPGIPLTPSTALIPPNAVPTLKIPMEDLMTWSFTPNEAFIVSRINGHWDVKSIVKISPFTEIEVLRVFRRLHEGGVITWQ
jgi:hypothetical protein